MNILPLLGVLSILVILIVFGYLRYDRNRWRTYALRAESDAWAWYLSSCEQDRQIAAMQEYLYTVSLSQQAIPDGKGKQTQLSLPLPVVAIRKDGSTDVGVESSNGKPKSGNGKDKTNGKDSAQPIEFVIADVESIAGKIDQRGKDKIAVWHSGKGKNTPAEYAKRIKAMGAVVH